MDRSVQNPSKRLFRSINSEDIEPLGFFGRDVNLLFGELPSVRDITLCTDMRFVTIKEIYFSFLKECFKFLQLFGLVRIELRQRFTLGTFPYTSISCANAENVWKLFARFRARSLLPSFFGGTNAWAVWFDGLRTASSSKQSMMALHPWPGRIYKPLTPSSSKRLTQPPTVGAVISVCFPTLAALKPSALSNMARQRIRKQWLSPIRKPIRSSRRSELFSIIFLIFIYLTFLLGTKIRKFNYTWNNYEQLLISIIR